MPLGKTIFEREIVIVSKGLKLKQKWIKQVDCISRLNNTTEIAKLFIDAEISNRNLPYIRQAYLAKNLNRLIAETLLLMHPSAVCGLSGVHTDGPGMDLSIHLVTAHSQRPRRLICCSATVQPTS